MSGYIYLIRLREFVRLKEETYKIGRTTKTANNRLSKYPKDSERILSVNNSLLEKYLILLFDFFISL